MNHRLATVLVGMAVLSCAACAYTDYRLITDNDQTARGEAGPVDTHGKAHMLEKSQVGTIWPDGVEETFSFVDQRANGDRTITTYTNSSSLDEPYFHDDMYCSPEWSGCAVITADDPEIGDVDIFDYRANSQCEGIRSIEFLMSGSRYGECGRARLPLQDRIALLNMGRVGQMYGVDGLFYPLDATNLTIELANEAGTTTTLPVVGEARAFVSWKGAPRMALDLTHPLIASTARSYADFLASTATHETEATLMYNGISMPCRIAGNVGLSSPERVLANANRHY